MTNRALVIAWALAVGLLGCKKDEAKQEVGGGAKKGTGGTQVQAPTRPSQNAQLTMPALELAADPLRADKVALGHALFFDKRLSVDGSRACVSCHLNEDGNGGHDPTAIGAADKKLPRHAPVIWNVAYWKSSLAWDGRQPTLEDQVKLAWVGGPFGVPAADLPKKVAEIAKIPGYKKMFDAAFPKQEVTADLFASAIAEYERTLICNETAYDKFAGGDKTALDEAQQRGLDVFLGKGGCATCHTPPFFSAAMNIEGGAYFNAGIGTQGKPEGQVDQGRMVVTKAEADWAAFKPPSLRNVTLSPPYFHDGSAASLDEALKIMAGGGIENKNLMRALLTDKKLTAEEMADLKAFLKGLECPNKLVEPKLP